jgi:flagellar biosynthesis component FlhA
MRAPARSALRTLAWTSAAALALAALALPIPAFALDALQLAHLAATAWVVASALRARSARDLGAFPAALAGVTVLRLALEVAFARAALGAGGVGAIAPALGAGLAAQGVAPALAALALLAVSQLVLVARGAERAAEVSARFALDALPGAQLAIDADLRAGALDAVAAQHKREALLDEARVHGALDGALRFVKGDAVVGLLAASVNLVGGALTGALRDGMAAADALAHYGALAAGQGVATRVPALAVATAAMVVVTRTRIGDEAPAAAATPGLAITVDGAHDGAALARRCDAELARLGVDARVAVAPGARASLAVRGTPVATLRGDADVATWLVDATRAHAWRLVGVEEARVLVDEVARDAPTLARAAVSGAGELARLADVLQRLVREGVAVRPARDVLEAFARHAPHEAMAVALTERVRASLRARISHARCVDGALSALALHPVIEDALRDHAARRPWERPAADLADDLVAAVRGAAGGAPQPVIVTDGAVRWYVRAALEEALPGAVALARAELEPDVAVTTVAVASPE